MSTTSGDRKCSRAAKQYCEVMDKAIFKGVVAILPPDNQQEKSATSVEPADRFGIRSEEEPWPRDILWNINFCPWCGGNIEPVKC